MKKNLQTDGNVPSKFQLFWRNTLGAALIFAFGALSTGCVLETTAACEGEECEQIAQREQALFPKTSVIWRSSSIPVCWENPGANDATKRGWVKDAVNSTWAAETRVKFTGWGTCAASSKGIRIKVTDEQTWSKLGRDMDGDPNGMKLNFRFINWNPNCAAADSIEACIRLYAVHEFGHALGLSHEQNRSDTPWSCAQPADPDTKDWGEVLIGPYDPDSIMNYCNPRWDDINGYSAVDLLSPADIKYSRYFYGNPTESVAERASADWGTGKLFFFNKKNYVRYDFANKRMDDGYPKSITSGWSGFPAAWSGSIDEVVNWGGGTVYFFKGADFVTVTTGVTTAPARISSLIDGWPAAWTKVDAVVNVPASSPGKYWDKKVYFFRGSEYLRVNATTKTVDLTPRAISAGWPGVFTENIDYAFARSNKVYFFKGTKYARFNMSNTAAENKVDAGYPHTIQGYWPGAPF